MAGPAALYSKIQPSGVDFGAIAERGVERLLREKRADEKERIAAIKQIRAERDARDKFALDAFSQDAFVKQTTNFSEQIYQLDEDTKEEMLRLADKVAQTGSYQDKISLKKFTLEAELRAMRIGGFLKSVENINGKFTSVDKDNFPEYSPGLNASKQLLLSQVMSGKDGYSIDFKTFKIKGPDGKEINAQDFITQNFSDLKRYMDPDRAVDDFLKGTDRTPFNSREMVWMDENGKEHSRTVYDTDYDDVKEALYPEFLKTFTSDNLAWQEYADQTDDPEAEVTENMFRRGLARNGFMFTTTKETQKLPGEESVTESSKASRRKMSEELLVDIASGGEGTAGVSLFKGTGQRAENHYNPITGKVGITIYKEGKAPYVIEDISTTAGAAEVLEYATRGRTGTYARFDDLSDQEKEKMINNVVEAAKNIPKGKKQEMIKASYRGVAEASVGEALETVGGISLNRQAKRNKDSVNIVNNIIEDLEGVVSADNMSIVKDIIKLKKNGNLVIGTKTFTVFNEDTKDDIINAVIEVVENLGPSKEIEVKDEGIEEKPTPTTGGKYSKENITKK